MIKEHFNIVQFSIFQIILKDKDFAVNCESFYM
jgi:hypothetical protein